MAFLEYPKWLRHPHHGELIVNDAEEEQTILAAWEDMPVPAGEPDKPEAPALMSQPPKARGWPKGKPRKPRMQPEA